MLAVIITKKTVGKVGKADALRIRSNGGNSRIRNSRIGLRRPISFLLTILFTVIGKRILVLVRDSLFFVLRSSGNVHQRKTVDSDGRRQGQENPGDEISIVHFA